VYWVIEVVQDFVDGQFDEIDTQMSTFKVNPTYLSVLKRHLLVTKPRSPQSAPGNSYALLRLLSESRAT
jgi:hypothetical protein